MYVFKVSYFKLAGLLLVGGSIAATLRFSTLWYVAPPNFTTAPRIVTIFGLLIFFIAVFGCWIKENIYYLIAYVVSMLFLAAGKIYLAVVIFRSLGQVERLVANWLGAAFIDDELKPKFHDVEIAFQCCGTIGPGSYLSPVLPDSCCLEPAINVDSQQICTIENAQEGCNNVLSQFCTAYAEAVGIVIVAIIAVQLAAIVFSLSIYYNGDNNREHYT
ncbi:unnamed protein product [Euphydryas editha]|uniref:Tetraspanin n=1 Tax=Euphydryas editha TaxID=104508 RepID=A0AAU9TUS3_EUPED|nr:unnamed protein product [Euphydryas editha]